MGESDDAKPSQDAEPEETGTNVRHILFVAILSIIAIAPVYSLDLTLQTLFDMQISEVISSLLPVLLLTPLPAAYIATISKKGFRKEAFGTLVAAPFALLNLQLAAFAAGIILGSIMVSYKAKSIYNGRNTNWMHFKAAGSMVTILAITIGITTASFYAGTPEFRENIRGNLTQHSVDTAFEYANLAGVSPAGNTDTMLGDGQAQLIGDFSGTLAENISTASIQSTEALIFQAVQEAQAQDSSTFDPNERSVLRAAFNTAENQIPPQLSQQTQEQVQGQFSGLDQGSGASSGTLRSMVTPRVRSFVDQLITNSQEMAFVAFIAAFSIVMMFKLPFEFLSAIYAAILGRLIR